MTNGDMINELRSIAGGDEKVSQSQMNRLVLAAVASIYDKQEQLLCELEEMRKTDQYDRSILRQNQVDLSLEVKKNLSDLNNAQQRLEIHQRSLKQEFNTYTATHKEEVNSIVKLLTDEIELLKKNFFILAGGFINKHPKASLVVTLGFFVLINLWFLPDVRHVILSVLGFPPTLLDFLPVIVTPIPTPMP